MDCFVNMKIFNGAFFKYKKYKKLFMVGAV